MDQNRLIIGCGYLGRVVGSYWLKENGNVYALTRSRSEELAVLGYKPILGDVTSAASLEIPPVDSILYAVGMDRSSGKSMRDVYVGGLTKILDRIASSSRFIYVSSTSVYGQTDGSIVNEESLTEPAEESGKIILECEQLIRSRLSHAVILRFAGIYGPGRIIRRDAISRGETIICDPEKWLNMIHVEDGARAVVAIEKHFTPKQIFNVVDNEPVRRRDYYREMGRCLNSPEVKFELPSAGQTAGPHDSTNRRISNKKLKSSLNFEFLYPTYREGLKQAIQSRS